MRRYLYWGISALAVGGVAVAIALFASPTGKRAVPEGVGNAEAFGTLSSCYPSNQFSEEQGDAFKSIGSGIATFSESEVQSSSNNEEDDYLGGKVVWSFSQAMDTNSGAQNDTYNGNFGGFLIATVYWTNGDVTKFKSRCLYEVGTKFDNLDEGHNKFESNLGSEGWVTGFPGNTSGQNATAALVMKSLPGLKNVSVKFSVNLGTRCNQGNPETELTVGANQIEPVNLQETGQVSGVMKNPETEGGAHSYPSGSSPGYNCPNDND